MAKPNHTKVKIICGSDIILIASRHTSAAAPFPQAKGIPLTSHLSKITCIADLQRIARRKVPKMFYDYADTGSWSEATYPEFSRTGGSRPLVVGYASSPAAEVHYGKGKFDTPPTGVLFLKGGVFRQVEGAAVLNGAKQPALAAKLVQYLQSAPVQKAVPTEMWVYPAVKNTPLPDVFKHARAPQHSDNPSEAAIAKNQRRWVSQWIRVVLK